MDVDVIEMSKVINQDSAHYYYDWKLNKKNWY